MALEHVLAILAARSRTAKEIAAVEAAERNARQGARRDWLRSVIRVGGTSVRSRMKKESCCR